MTCSRSIVVVLSAGLGLAAAVSGAVATVKAPTTDPRVVDIVRAGKLRVGLFLPQYGKGPDGLKPTVWVETARAYAARVGVSACDRGACDAAGSYRLPQGRFVRPVVLPLDARAVEIGDFSNPIFQFDYTLMVPAGSSIATVADADRPGVRIAAVRNHASTNGLVRQIKQADFVYAETPEQTFALMRDGKAGVMASTRLVLLDFSGKTGRRTCACRPLRRQHQPYGRPQRQGGLARLRQRVRRGGLEEAKASGAVQQFIERGGTRGVTVAQLGNSS